MINRYVMSRGQTVNFIRKHFDDFVYESMRLARYDVTREECVQGLDINTENGKALRNFKRTLQFLLDTPDLEINYSYLLDLHWVLMDGLMDMITNELTDQQVEVLYQMINQPTKGNTEVALDVMLYILNKRLFADGDVRAALMFANKIMLEGGNGYISIPERKDKRFRELLKEAHHTENGEEFKQWLYSNCIWGIKNDY